MSDKTQSSAQPLTDQELKNRAVVLIHGVGTGVYAFIDRLLATIDADRERIAALEADLREGHCPYESENQDLRERIAELERVPLCKHDGTPMEMMCRNCGDKCDDEARAFWLREFERLERGKRRLLEGDAKVFSAALNELPFTTTASEPTFSGDFDDLRDAIKAAAQAAFERAETREAFCYYGGVGQPHRYVPVEGWDTSRGICSIHDKK